MAAHRTWASFPIVKLFIMGHIKDCRGRAATTDLTSNNDRRSPVDGPRRHGAGDITDNWWRSSNSSDAVVPPRDVRQAPLGEA